MKPILTILLLTLPTVVGLAGEQDDVVAEAASGQVAVFEHDGIWKPKGALLGGNLLPPQALKAITMTVKGDTYEVHVEGEDHVDKGTAARDESVTPHRMTIKSLEGPNKGKTILAIYEIKGPNAYRVCYDLSGKAFPKEFKSPKGSKLYLVGYRRQTETAIVDSLSPEAKNRDEN